MAISESISPQPEHTKTPIDRWLFQHHLESFSGLTYLDTPEGRRSLTWKNGNCLRAQSSLAKENFLHFLMREGVIDADKATEWSQSSQDDENIRHRLESETDLSAFELTDLRLRHQIFIIQQILDSKKLERVSEPQVIDENLKPLPLLSLILEKHQREANPELLQQLFSLKSKNYPKCRDSLFIIWGECSLSPELYQLQYSLSGQESFEDILLKTSDDIGALRLLYSFEQLHLLQWEQESQTNNTPEDKALSLDDLKITAEQLSASHLYNVLEISESATTSEIKTAFEAKQKQIEQWSSLKRNPEGAALIRQIESRVKDAYLTLSDDSAREEYSKLIHQKQQDSVLSSKNFLRAQDFFHQGLKFLHRKDIVSAHKQFSEAERIWPEGAEYKLYRLYAEFKIKHQEQNKEHQQNVIGQLEAFIQENPHDELPTLLLGYVYQEKGNLTAAREQYEKVLQSHPDNPEALAALQGFQKRVKTEPSTSTWQFPVESILKNLRRVATITLTFFTIAAAYYAWSLHQENQDPLIHMIDAQKLSAIWPAISIRQKDDIAKITFKSDYLMTIPDTIFHSKCLQSFESLGSYGIIKLQLLDEEKGLLAICRKDHEKPLRFNSK